MSRKSASPIPHRDSVRREGWGYWTDLDTCRYEVAACHGLIQRIFCVLRLEAEDHSFNSKVIALEKWCAERERDYRGGV